MSQNKATESTILTALCLVLGIGVATFCAAMLLDPAPPRHCNPGTVEALFTPCDQRVTK